MDESVRVVTELRLRREAQEFDRHMLVARLQLRCEDGGQGLDARTLRDWEDRGHTPSAVCAVNALSEVTPNMTPPTPGGTLAARSAMAVACSLSRRSTASHWSRAAPMVRMLSRFSS